jgi:hypothetical protein
MLMFLVQHDFQDGALKVDYDTFFLYFSASVLNSILP